MGTVVALNVKENFVTEVCCACGGIFAIPRSLYDSLQRDHNRSFYCPKGHQQWYVGQTQEQKLRAKLGRMEQDRDGWRRQEEQRARQLSAARGVTTRIKNRIGNGVCPCCKRSFLDLKRHMTCKHADYGK